MLITTGLCLAATGVVALSLESTGAALVFFGVAGLYISRRIAYQPEAPGSRAQMEPPLGPEILKDPCHPDFKNSGALRIDDD